VVDLGASQLGGLAAPKFSIVGLSRQIGLVGGKPGEAVQGMANVALNQFHVQDWLSGALDDIKLFGVFRLIDLIPNDLDLKDKLTSQVNAPRMVTQALDGISTQEITWDVPLFGTATHVDIPDGLGRIQPISGTEARLFIQVISSVDKDTGHVHSQTVCKITNVELVLSLLGKDIVTVPLTRLQFTTADGKKPDVDCALAPITFGGILSFVATLASLCDTAGFNDPPALEMLQDGVRSSFSTPVPAVSVGMFCLENITFGAALSVYFSGQPVELALNFATFENPFRLTVSALGGGGYLGVKVNTRGLQEISGALEFGAALSVNLGVARGSVSAMGGIYFKLEYGDASLTGYLRIRGELDVLGLISVGVELMLALAYVSKTSKVEGYAEMAVRVKALFFRKTVHIEFHKQFAGANGDPTFAELMAPDGWTGALPWDDYCTAFAEA
jgi:hypothetical protein